MLGLSMMSMSIERTGYDRERRCGVNRAELYHSKTFNPINYIIKAVILYLRANFANNSEFGYTVCSEEQISDAQAMSGLLISDQNTWDTTFRGHLPSIIIQRGNASFGGGAQSGDMSRILNTGIGMQTTVMEMMTLPMVCSVVTRQDLEAEQLALLVASFLHDDKRWANAFGIFGIQSPLISPVQVLDPKTSSFICTVSTALSTSRKYDVRLLPEQKLTDISLSLNGQHIQL